MKAPYPGSGRPGVQAVPSAWRKDSCGLDFPPGNDIPKGTWRAEPRLPFFLQPERPERFQEWREWCPVPWAPGAVADPSSEKVTDAFQAGLLGYTGISFLFNFSRYLQVEPWKGTNHEQPNELVN